MSWAVQDRDKLKQAIATGAKRVRFQTHETEFRSQEEMMELLDRMNAEIDPATSSSRRTVAVFHRGLS